MRNVVNYCKNNLNALTSVILGDSKPSYYLILQLWHLVLCWSIGARTLVGINSYCLNHLQCTEFSLRMNYKLEICISEHQSILTSCSSAVTWVQPYVWIGNWKYRPCLLAIVDSFERRRREESHFFLRGMHRVLRAAESRRWWHILTFWKMLLWPVLVTPTSTLTFIEVWLNQAFCKTG